MLDDTRARVIIQQSLGVWQIVHVMKHERDVLVFIGIHVANGQEPDVFHGAAIEWASVALVHEKNAVFLGRHVL